MSKMKKRMMKGMNKIMLSCDTATYLITRSEYEKLSCINRMQLKMHLVGCKYCRRFAEQSKYISEQLKKVRNPETQNITVCLTEKQKQKINLAIENQINKV
jgi:hypothetical protein